MLLGFCTRPCLTFVRELVGLKPLLGAVLQTHGCCGTWTCHHAASSSASSAALEATFLGVLVFKQCAAVEQ